MAKVVFHIIPKEGIDLQEVIRRLEVDMPEIQHTWTFRDVVLQYEGDKRSFDYLSAMREKKFGDYLKVVKLVEGKGASNNQLEVTESRL